MISDTGFPGLVIKLNKSFKDIYIDKDEKRVYAGGGCYLPKLGKVLADNGWSGFEFMCVIPGTVGAAVRMNAGTANAGEIKDHFYCAEILTKDLKEKIFFAKELKFSHRYSELAKTNCIVLKAVFQLKNMGSVKLIKERIKDIYKKRRQNQPKNHKNCGSVFKRPEGERSAGWYIEQAGFKGKRIGNAQVAQEHANWIINLGEARADDVKDLILNIQKTVLEKFSVKLERELIYIPEDIITS